MGMIEAINEDLSAIKQGIQQLLEPKPTGLEDIIFTTRQVSDFSGYSQSAIRKMIADKHIRAIAFGEHAAGVGISYHDMMTLKNAKARKKHE